MQATRFRKGDAVKLTGGHLGAFKNSYGVVEEARDNIDAYGRHYGSVSVKLLASVEINGRRFESGLFGVSAVSKA